MKRSYPAIRYSQLPNSEKAGGKQVICFCAPCDEIVSWAGIPRKGERVVGESDDNGTLVLHGYQRAQEGRRIEKLVNFFQNPANIIPTSILLAARHADAFDFKATNGATDFGGVLAEPGALTVIDDLDRNAPLSRLLSEVADLLVARHKDLATEAVDDKTFARWKGRLSETGSPSPEALASTLVGDADHTESDAELSPEQMDMEDGAINPYNPDVHLVDFYREIRLRQKLCEELPFLESGEAVLGLDRSTIFDFLSPMTVVDGQHRLLGANESLDKAAERYLQTEEVGRLLAEGSQGAALERDFRQKNRRIFSASLICSTDWTEHVFHFVVVNQQVKPIPKALLSSIIATSLSAQEIGQIQNRLEQAGIEIDDYRVMGRLIEDDSSPFKNLVKKGYGANRSDDAVRLEWAVLNRMASDFRSLSRDLTPYDRRTSGEVRKFQEWRDRFLFGCSWLAAHMGTDNTAFATPQDAWSDAVSGLWIDAFLEFFRQVRKTLADPENPEAAWTDPNRSNLYNGATMRALLADFGDYLYDKEIAPESFEDYTAHVKKYVGRMKPAFFGRPWNIVGKRMDKVNLERVSKYLRNHRDTGKIDGKWLIFPK